MSEREVIELGHEFYDAMPAPPHHFGYRRTSIRRHGDQHRSDGGSSANDLVMMGTHVGTHIDAFCHASHDGRIYGGAVAGSSIDDSGSIEHAMETVPPLITRGWLLDIPIVVGVDRLPPGHVIDRSQLLAALQLGGLRPQSGDVLLIRTGWSNRFGIASDYLTNSAGVPGIDEDAARFLLEFRPIAIGADNPGVEFMPGPRHELVLPVHRLLLVDHGVYMLENLQLEDLHARGHTEFDFLALPLRLRGATASPIRPVAMI